MYKQAQAVAALNAARHSAEVVLRNHATLRWFLKLCRINPDDMAAAREFARASKTPNGCFEGLVPAYLAGWASRGDVVAKIGEMEGQMFAGRRPLPHPRTRCHLLFLRESPTLPTVCREKKCSGSPGGECSGAAI